MKKLGFIGLGIMGQPMAVNLLKAGFPLAVFNRTAAKCSPVVSLGARQVHSPKELASGSDVVITMLSDTRAVEDVLSGEDGVFSGLRPGKIVIDMSTISPRRTVEFAARLRQEECEILDAPVSGGEKGAREGILCVMVGGRFETFQECLPIFQALGKSIAYMGPTGSGQKTKLVNQVIGSLNVLAMVESLRLAREAGLDVRKTLEIVSSGAASSWMLTNLGPKILANDFAPGFSIRLQQKDLTLARELIAELGGEFPGTELAYRCFTEALEKGLGDQGNHGLINVWTEK